MAFIQYHVPYRVILESSSSMDGEEFFAANEGVNLLVQMEMGLLGQPGRGVWDEGCLDG